MGPAPHDRDLRRVYETRSAAGSGPAVSSVERALMADTFLAVGRQAPTLSGAWDAHHLAAHLVLRESDPLGSVKAVLPSWGDRAVDDLVGRAAFEDLVHRFETGPPHLSVFRIPGSDGRLNALEHVIHHEDLRRAQPEWTRRDLPTWAHDQLWRPLRRLARLLLRHAPAPIVLARSDTGEESVARKGAGPVVVRGPPAELALYVYGRGSVADVDLDGDPDAVDRIRRETFGR